MKPIRKLQIWLNPTSVGAGPRWDAEIVFDDDTHERRSGVTRAEFLNLVRIAMKDSVK